MRNVPISPSHGLHEIGRAAAYLGKAQHSWLTTDFTLAMFHREPARQAYHRFVLDGVGCPSDRELFMGRGDEPRVLDSDRFLEAIDLNWQPRSKRTLDSLIESLCRRHQVCPNDLSASGRRRDLAQLRVLIAQHSLKLRIATLSDLARRFNRSVSTLCESLEHFRVGGGAATVRQYLEAKLIDEMHLAVRPVLLGRGERIFGELDARALGYEVAEIQAGERATHMLLRRKGAS